MTDMIFARESIADMVGEAEPLLRLHYDEIAWKKEKIPLAPDWNQYAMLELQGKLLCFSGRVGGKLKGYSAFFFAPLMHYSHTMAAVNDIIFLHPDYRSAGYGAGLIQYAERELKALGAVAISYHIKTKLDWSPLVAKLGYEPTETNHWKWVGD